MDRWRLIIDPPMGGAENMASDEAMLLHAGTEGKSIPPTLRLYGWLSPTISIGCHQDAGQFSGHALPVVRRITGGRAVLHHMELTYSIVAHSDAAPFSGGIMGAYRRISSCIALALKDIGIDAGLSEKRKGYEKTPACFNSSVKYEVLVGGRKIAGSAQRRFKGVFLQHGSVLVQMDRALNESVFGGNITGAMTCVGDQAPAGREELQRAFIERVSIGLGASFTPGELTGSERRLMDTLVQAKYSQDEWNLYRDSGGLHLNALTYHGT